MIAGMPRSRTLKLAAIAAAAGVFSGLFGVGGGTIIVPLLVFWFGYGEHQATGTSLADEQPALWVSDSTFLLYLSEDDGGGQRLHAVGLLTGAVERLLAGLGTAYTPRA